jgi:ferritin
MTARFSERMEQELNLQMTREAEASQLYLSFASWAEVQGYPGIAKFLFHHSDEERVHMLKFIAFINQRGGHCKISALGAPPADPQTLHELFEKIQEQEIKNSNEINKIVEIGYEDKDYPTNNFLQWFVQEQLEEEALATQLLDQLKIIGEESPNRGGLYEFDRNIASLHDARVAEAGGDS